MADANLISASPDMYEALQLAKQSILDYGHGEDDWKRIEAAQPTQCPTSACADCDAAARYAYSDARTPGFFSSKCRKHEAAPYEPRKEGRE